MQNLKIMFENLWMYEDENVTSYMQRVDEVVISIRGLGGELKEIEVVKKILGTLPKSYSHKVSTIEEFENLNQYTRDQLYGFLTTFEMREYGTNSGAKVETALRL